MLKFKEQWYEKNTLYILFFDGIRNAVAHIYAVLHARRRYVG